MPKAMPREKMDEYVAEAMSQFPDMQVDPKVSQDLELAQKLQDLSDSIEPLMLTTINAMRAKVEAKGPLALLEMGLFLLTPRINEHIYPPIPMVSAMFGMLASSFLGMHYISERNITRGGEVDGDDYEAFVNEHFESVVRFVVSMPKEEFYEALHRILVLHTNSLNGTTGDTE